MSDEPKTSAELIDRLRTAFDSVPPESSEAVDAELTAVGLDPRDVGERMEGFVEGLLASSPHDWRKRAPVERRQAMAKRHRVAEVRRWPRQRVVHRIREVQAGLPERMAVNFRDYQSLPDEDLASLLADLEFIAAEEADEE